MKKEVLDNAVKWALKNLKDKKVFHPDIEDYVIFNADGIKHSIYAKNYELKAKLIYHAITILNNSRLFAIEKDKKNRPDILNIYKFSGSFVIDRKFYFIYIIVRETKKGKFYYDHGVIKEKP